MTDISGIVAVNKPQNWTSHDCVAVVRKVIGVKRVGHTGTLDPMATGVLPVCVGSAARITEYMDLDYKTYSCTMKLGITTDTLDIWGEILEKKTVKPPEREEIIKIMKDFTGEISQIPPKYSAIKVNGKKLYEYARAGKEVEIKPRKVFIKSLTLDGINSDEISFTVECSKGTYIRSLCQDIGNALGCGAAMSALVRTKTGVFSLGECIDIEDIKNMTREELSQRLFTPDYPLVHFGKVDLERKYAIDFVNGKRIAKENIKIMGETFHENMYNIYCGESFLGVAKLTKGSLKAHKVFDVRMQNDNF